MSGCGGDACSNGVVRGAVTTNPTTTLGLQVRLLGVLLITSVNLLPRKGVAFDGTAMLLLGPRFRCPDLMWIHDMLCESVKGVVPLVDGDVPPSHQTKSRLCHRGPHTGPTQSYVATRMYARVGARFYGENQSLSPGEGKNTMSVTHSLSLLTASHHTHTWCTH